MYKKRTIVKHTTTNVGFPGCLSLEQPFSHTLKPPDHPYRERWFSKQPECRSFPTCNDTVVDGILTFTMMQNTRHSVDITFDFFSRNNDSDEFENILNLNRIQNFRQTKTLFYNIDDVTLAMKTWYTAIAGDRTALHVSEICRCQCDLRQNVWISTVLPQSSQHCCKSGCTAQSRPGFHRNRARSWSGKYLSNTDFVKIFLRQLYAVIKWNCELRRQAARWQKDYETTIEHYCGIT